MEHTSKDKEAESAYVGVRNRVGKRKRVRNRKWEREGKIKDAENRLNIGYTLKIRNLLEITLTSHALNSKESLNHSATVTFQEEWTDAILLIMQP